MTESDGNRPAEIFGYPLANQSVEAQRVRQQHLCPFGSVPCNKKSRLLDVPFGVCSVQARAGMQVICPRRFDEVGSLAGVPRVLEDVATHYFGDTNNIVVFAETRLPNVGNIDFVIVKHRAMRPEIDEFVAVENSGRLHHQYRRAGARFSRVRKRRRHGRQELPVWRQYL